MGKILVIDDEEIIRIRLRDLLALDGHQAFAAGSGTEGLELFARERPDIVVVDLRMPGMDGLEVLRNIKQTSERTEVIILTGHGGVETAIDAMKQGAFSYLQKPLEYDELAIDIKRIYEKISLNEKVEKYVRDLEKTIRERDTELEHRLKAENDLREANKVAEAANKAKSIFLANMSHEIRTPLNGIVGFCELLLDTELTALQRSYAEPLRSCGTALLMIVNDILDISKIEANKLDIEKIEFDIRSILSDLLDVFSLHAREKGLVVEFHINPKVPSLLIGDPGRLRQVISNLLSNAIKFTEKGSVSLHVELENEIDTKVILKITIHDTGIGISAKNIPMLFSPFEQGDKSTTRRFGGTGLGLAISRQLVEKMGGQIEIESKEGHGSTFWFTVELVKTIEKNTKVLMDNAVKTESNSTTEVKKSDVHILVAEDNPLNQTVVIAVLKKLGYSADVVSNGAEAVKVLQNITYHMVLMDCQMPEMDGYTATRHIREAASDVLNPQIPIIAMTASATPEDREACLKAGMNDYLSKPVMREKLEKAIEHWLNLKEEKNVLGK